jgi:hypothetical protein
MATLCIVTKLADYSHIVIVSRSGNSIIPVTFIRNEYESIIQQVLHVLQE